MPDFVKIDRTEVAGLRDRISPRTAALLAGETIFVPGDGKWRAGAIKTMRAHHLRLVTRAMTRAGVAGYAAWTEPLLNGQASA